MIINCDPQVLFYEGSENPINYKRKYTKDFSCDIKLNNYPFDSQVCSLRLTQCHSFIFLLSALQDEAGPAL